MTRPAPAKIAILLGATVFDVARSYCALQRNEPVSPEQDRMMRKALSKPGIRRRFIMALSGH